MSGRDAQPADPTKIPPNSRANVVIKQDWQYLDGQSVGPVGPPVLLAIYTTSPQARREMTDGQEPIIRLVNGRVSHLTESSIAVIVANHGGKPEEFPLADAIAKNPRRER